MRLLRAGVLSVLLVALILAIIGIANGQINTPVVTAAKTTVSPVNPEDQFWSSVNGTTIKTSGNPLNGGHGSVPRTPDVLVKAAYTDTDLFMFFEWNDPTNDKLYGYWTYDAGEQKWVASDPDEVNEDRLFLAWPIVDVPGRDGKTFAEAGCASICHKMDAGNNIVPSPGTPVNDCGDCHYNSGVKPADYKHNSSGACNSCHADRSPSTLADMVAPEGGSYDLWHWKAGRAGNIGFADDQSTVNGKKRGNDGSPGLDYDNKAGNGPKYIWPLNDGKTASTGTFEDVVKVSTLAGMVELSADGTTLKDDTSTPVPNGTTVRNKILRDNETTATISGTSIPAAPISNMQIASIHRYAGGKYQIVLTRKLDTGDSKDYTFKLNGDNYFGIAVTDNSAANHAGNTLAKLVFDPATTPSPDDPPATETPVTQPGKPSFGDVGKSHWAFAYIERLVELKIINGFPGRVFKPGDAATRAEFAKILVLSLKETPKTNTGDKFSDISNHWATGYIEKASDLGVIKGYPNGQFRPNNRITRAEAVIMITRAFDLKTTDEKLPFSDTKSNHPAYAEITAAWKHGLINGYPDNVFKPEDHITRAEIAKIASLALQK